MKLVVAITGASGALYAQRLLDHLRGQEVHLVLSDHAKEVAALELDGGTFALADGIISYDNRSMRAPFVSGSARFDAMTIIPCSMGTLGRIANGASDDTICRAADVFLKERRKLILVPRETPYNLIHVRNMARLIEAGADIIPATPSFYSRPQTVQQVVDTVVARVLDHLGIEHTLAKRWMETES
ncbi:MAG: UbiX family flavin prenyltransferase [Verrucomicrobia bacterium]|nr:UbiX family flavin prenyltransferase [Verrucomicrobiota bacterium]